MDPGSDPASADRASTPASTGAQHDEAIPEKTPSANTPPASERNAGARRPAMLHERPAIASPPSVSISSPPVMYRGRW